MGPFFFFVGEFGTWAYAARRTGSEVGAVWRHGGARYVPYSGLTRVIRITSELLRLGSNAGITATCEAGFAYRPATLVGAKCLTLLA